MDNKEINVYVGATSLHTCLGDKLETIAAMDKGVSGLKFSERFNMFTGELHVDVLQGFTRFESLIIEQLDMIRQISGLDLSDESIQLILSTTKGNVELLAESDEIDEKVFLGTSAQIISEYFGCLNHPIVISNACISGVSAFVVARELMISGSCKHVVVVGCDVLSDFITQGFASLKSISSTMCKPYDVERDGLTLGEACGAVLLTTDREYSSRPYIYLNGGAITNDANHISAPSRTGEGLYYAMETAMSQAGISSNDVGFVNTHGTATIYNDEMESKAIVRAKLCDVPVNSLKGYIGHTLGASGVVELAVCIEELRQGYIFGTAGLDNAGALNTLKVSASNQHIDKLCCLKTASGFGGCNAAVVLDMECRNKPVVLGMSRKANEVSKYFLPHSNQPFPDYIRTEFKSLGELNMKFYKMSDMCKALYVAVERLLRQVGFDEVDPRRRSIVLANRSASLDTDLVHQHILNQHLPEGASPSVFVYTLANVASGEICIRHKIQGNNTFFIENVNTGLADRYAIHLIENDQADAVICGWCEYMNGMWNVDMKLFKQLSMEQIIKELKEHLVRELNLEDIKPEEIDTDAPLFGDGLGLDSIDALEIILILEKHYSVKLTNSSEAKPVFYSIRTLAEYIVKNQK